MQHKKSITIHSQQDMTGLRKHWSYPTRLLTHLHRFHLIYIVTVVLQIAVLVIIICNHKIVHPIYIPCIKQSSCIKPVTGPLSQILYDKLPPPCPSQYWLPARQVITYIILRRLVHNNLRDTKQCFTSIPWLVCIIFTVVLPWYSVFLKLWASQCFPTTNHS